MFPFLCVFMVQSSVSGVEVMCVVKGECVWYMGSEGGIGEVWWYVGRVVQVGNWY
jgi:hypothetical protein